MIYNEMYIGGVLIHADRANHKYINKIKTASGKWRYIYKEAANKKASLKEIQTASRNGTSSYVVTSTKTPHLQALQEKFNKVGGNGKSMSIPNPKKAIEDKVNDVVNNGKTIKETVEDSKSSRGSKGSSGSSKSAKGPKGKSVSSSKGSKRNTGASGSSNSSSKSAKAIEKEEERAASIEKKKIELKDSLKKEEKYYKKQLPIYEKLYNTYNNQKYKTRMSIRKAGEYRVKIEQLKASHKQNVVAYKEAIKELNKMEKESKR